MLNLFQITGTADKLARAKKGLDDRVKELEAEEEERVSGGGSLGTRPCG